MNIRHVFQRCESDCGVACVAMITGMTYEDAFAVIGYDEEENKFHTTHGHLAAVFVELGWDVRWKRFCSWETIPGCAIVAVNHRFNRRYFHWVVFDGESILDPSPQSQQRVDMQYRASGWYLLLLNGEDTSR